MYQCLLLQNPKRRQHDDTLIKGAFLYSILDFIWHNMGMHRESIRGGFFFFDDFRWSGEVVVHRSQSLENVSSISWKIWTSLFEWGTFEFVIVYLTLFSTLLNRMEALIIGLLRYIKMLLKFALHFVLLNIILFESYATKGSFCTLL